MRYDQNYFYLQLGQSTLTPYILFKACKPILQELGLFEQPYENICSQKDGYKTHVYALQQLLIEVLPESDLITRVTIF